MESQPTIASHKKSPRLEQYVQPVNGIVQPPVVPPPDRRGRRTTVLESLKSVLKVVWKSRWSFYFRYPVDAVALCIPDYHNLIKHPMDLSTIKRRLNNNYYWQADEALGDFELIFENCMLYNLEGTEVYKAGKELRDVFYTRLSYIDMSNETELVTTPSGRKRKTEPQQPPAKPVKAVKAVKAVMALRSEREPSVPMLVEQDTLTAQQLVPAVLQPLSDVEQPKEPERESSLFVENPPLPPLLLPENPIKLELQPKLLPDWQNYLVEKAHSEKLLRSLTKRKRLSINWPFKCCDLWVQYAQNPNYDHNQQEKLDWEILSKKLENNEFDNFEQFVSKLQEMFQNALTCFPLNVILIDAVNELNTIVDSRLDELRNSIVEMKNRIRHTVNKRLRMYNSVLSLPGYQ